MLHSHGVDTPPVASHYTFSRGIVRYKTTEYKHTHAQPDVVPEIAVVVVGGEFIDIGQGHVCGAALDWKAVHHAGDARRCPVVVLVNGDYKRSVGDLVAELVSVGIEDESLAKGSKQRFVVQQNAIAATL